MVWIVKKLVLFIIKPYKNEEYSVVIPIKGHSEDIEFTIRSIIAIFKWNDARNGNIICLDCGMDKETLCICKTLEKDTPFIKVKTPEQLNCVFSNV